MTTIGRELFDIAANIAALVAFIGTILIICGG
jgi:hypothetical protein